MHHANLIVGTLSFAHTVIPPSERIASPDVEELSFERMTLDDAHALLHDATLRPLVRTHRTFIIFAQVILPEAQNALLKIFEDATQYSRFFVIVPREQILLPTLRSRLYVLATQEMAFDDASFTAFLALSYAERLREIADRIDAEDIAWMRALTQSASSYAHTTRDTALMHDALMVEKYFPSPGSSKKILLEQLALSLPSRVR